MTREGRAVTPTRRVVIDWPVTARGLAVALGLEPAAFVAGCHDRHGLPVRETTFIDDVLAVELASWRGVALEVRRPPPTEEEAKLNDQIRGLILGDLE
jgi:hypothetical protein